MATMEMDPEIEQPQETKTKKKNFLGRLRRNRKKNNQTVRKEEEPAEDLDTTAPVVNDSVEEEDVQPAKMKTVRFPFMDAMKGKVPLRKEKQLAKPPTAKEAAFGGPPRYDWIDIETAAAIKVQSVYRRNKTMEELEQQGITTAAIRNRSRRRQARMEARGNTGSADVPNLFACCGVGLAFGDSTEEDYDAMRQYQRELFLQRKKDKEEYEANLRNKYQQKAARKELQGGAVQEVVEVVED